MRGNKMIKIIMHGCNGHMGQVISEIVEQDASSKIVAGIDLYNVQKNDYPVFKKFTECTVNADVIIDFASAEATDELLDYCTTKNVPVVLCTTGLSENQLTRINNESQKVAILKSANMSLGVNTLLKILKDATKVFAPAGYDIEIIEKHHNQKVDAPSGTALAIADSINEVLDHEYEYKYDRSMERKKREKNEIGISVVRGGTIVGEHEVLFAGTDEVIEFKHTAYSKSIFGKGAVEAAKFLAGKEAGLYNMGDVIG
jgi:4-hydroxy-tetrahydrodipicolinate reductase